MLPHGPREGGLPSGLDGGLTATAEASATRDSPVVGQSVEGKIRGGRRTARGDQAVEGDGEQRQSVSRGETANSRKRDRGIAGKYASEGARSLFMVRFEIN